ncbi:MAG: hypothetical protein KAJ47_01585 [Candidatus Aenigmarchaeota archaeon]|nr:hypothetical protein [Candidatus Aenigmarchaeota archaeon]
MGEATQTSTILIFKIIVSVVLAAVLFVAISQSTAFNNDNSYGGLAKNIAMKINYVSMSNTDYAREYMSLPNTDHTININEHGVEIITEKGVKFSKPIHMTDRTQIVNLENEKIEKGNKKVLCIIKNENVITFTVKEDKDDC